MADEDAERLKEQVRALEARVAHLEARLTARPPPPPASVPWQPAPGGYVPPTGGHAPPGGYAQPGAYAPPPGAHAGGAPPFAPAPRRAVDLERLVGGNLLAKAGMLVLVLGVAFGLRYAFEHDWISLGARIALGVVGGAAIFGGGEWLHRRGGYGVYPQILAAGGAMITYFSVFSAHFFEPYRDATGLGAGFATAILFVLAIGVAAYAVWRRAPVGAGVSAGLATVTSVTAAAWTTFGVTYTLMMGAALAGAAVFARWGGLAVAAAGSVFIALLTSFIETDTTHLDALVGGLGALVGASVVAFALDRREGVTHASLAVPVMAAFAPLAFWFVTAGAIELDYVTWRGPATLGVAVVATAAALAAAFTRARRYAAWAGAFAVTMLVFWPINHFEHHTMVIMTSLVGGLAVLGVVAAQLSAPRAARAFAFAAAAFTAAATFEAVVVLSSLANPPESGTLGGLAYTLTAALGVGAWLTLRGRVTGVAAYVPWFTLGAAAVTVFVATGRHLEGFWVAASWAAVAVAFTGVGFALTWRDLRVAGLASFGLVLGRLFLVDLARLDLGTRIIAFLVVGGLLLLGSFLYARAARGSAPGTE